MVSEQTLRGCGVTSAVSFCSVHRILQSDDEGQGNNDPDDGGPSVPIFGVILAALAGLILLAVAMYCCFRSRTECACMYRNGCLKVICIGCLGCQYCCPSKSPRKRLQKGNLSTEEDGAVTMAQIMQGYGREASSASMANGNGTSADVKQTQNPVDAALGGAK